MSYMEFVLKHVVLKVIHHIITQSQSINFVVWLTSELGKNKGDTAFSM